MEPPYKKIRTITERRRLEHKKILSEEEAEDTDKEEVRTIERGLGIGGEHGQGSKGQGSKGQGRSRGNGREKKWEVWTRKK